MNFCPNCGNQLKEGVNFCTNCGTPVKSKPAAAPTPQPKPQPTPQPVKTTTQKTSTKQKSGGVKVGRIVLSIIIILIVIGIVVGTNNERKNDDLNSGNDAYQVDELDVANPAYTAIFAERGIVDESDLAGKGLGYDEFAMVSAEGMIDKMEYGYTKDVVSVLVETVYYPITGYSADQITQIETAMKSEFAPVEALSFATVTYDVQSEYFVIEIMLEGLDNANNIQAAANAGIIQLTDANAEVLSYSQSSEAVLAAGYIQKY